MKKCAYFALLVLGLWGCVEPFEPEVGAYDSTLVVDGVFTDGADTSTVILSRSYAYSGEEVEYISGAVVVVEDDQGNRAVFTENFPGKYQNDPEVFTGIPGREYRLSVTTADGQFVSDWEKMKAAPPIEQLYFEPGERAVNDPEEPPRKGLQVYLDTRDGENNTRYYRWEYAETYQYGLTFPPYIRVIFGPRPGLGNDRIEEIPFTELEGYRCWKTEASTRFFIATTEHLTEDVIKAFPLVFVDNRSPRLSQKYSLLVRQFALSKENYEYLETIASTNQTTGGLFDPIPNEVFGNVRSVDDRNLPVLGYFSVAGSSTTRYFIERSELPEGLNPPFGPDCVSDTLETLDYRELYFQVANDRNILHNYRYNMFTGNPDGYIIAKPVCALCAPNGATNQQPEYW